MVCGEAADRAAPSGWHYDDDTGVNAAPGFPVVDGAADGAITSYLV